MSGSCVGLVRFFSHRRDSSACSWHVCGRTLPGLKEPRVPVRDAVRSIGSHRKCSHQKNVPLNLIQTLGLKHRGQGNKESNTRRNPGWDGRSRHWSLKVSVVGKHEGSGVSSREINEPEPNGVRAITSCAQDIKKPQGTFLNN